MSSLCGESHAKDLPNVFFIMTDIRNMAIPITTARIFNTWLEVLTMLQDVLGTAVG